MLIASVPSPEPLRRPRVVVFDSGLGGLTVFAELVRRRPDADYLYAADDAVFPYGRLAEAALVERVLELMERLVASHRPDAVVIACHTASTLVLAPLRARWPLVRFVGTVPAIKPAAAASRSGLVSVLGTPGTVARDYTRDLIRDFAGGCAVTLVGSRALAGLAEAALRGEPIADAAVAAEIGPVFVDAGGRRTDTVVLACTHYPLLGPTLERLAPWPVTWIDPAPAIARRLDDVLRDLGHPPGPGSSAPAPTAALFTSAREPGPVLRRALEARGIGRMTTLADTPAAA